MKEERENPLTHDDDLDGDGGADRLRVDQLLVAEVVEAALLEDLRAGLEPDGLAKVVALGGQVLGGDAAGVRKGASNMIRLR
jgi:hypothetical protein